MNLSSIQKLLHNRNFAIALAVVASILLISGVGFLIADISNKLTKKPTAVTLSSAEQLKSLEQQRDKVKLTLEQEKKDRAKVHEALDAPKNYQKLAF
jgi:predicted PurR-regulated permease PerM